MTDESDDAKTLRLAAKAARLAAKRAAVAALQARMRTRVERDRAAAAAAEAAARGAPATPIQRKAGRSAAKGGARLAVKRAAQAAHGPRLTVTTAILPDPLAAGRAVRATVVETQAMRLVRRGVIAHADGEAFARLACAAALVASSGGGVDPRRIGVAGGRGWTGPDDARVDAAQTLRLALDALPADLHRAALMIAVDEASLQEVGVEVARIRGAAVAGGGHGWRIGRDAAAQAGRELRRRVFPVLWDGA